MTKYYQCFDCLNFIKHLELSFSKKKDGHLGAKAKRNKRRAVTCKWPIGGPKGHNLKH